MSVVRVLLADNHEIVRIGIKSALNQHGNYRVCAEVSDGRLMVEETCRLKPDLVIMEIALPLLNGFEAARQILVRSPRPFFLAFTRCQSEKVMLETLRNGVTGFVSKADGTCDLLTAIEAVTQGRTFFGSQMTAMLLKLARRETYNNVLSGLEREILQLLAEGYSTKEIAGMLAMNIKTLETHRSNFMRKLGIHCIAELVQYAVRNHVIHIGHVCA